MKTVNIVSWFLLITFLIASNLTPQHLNTAILIFGVSAGTMTSILTAEAFFEFILRILKEAERKRHRKKY